MERVTFKRFDIGQEIESVDVDARGYKWLVYWLLGEDESVCYITDGSAYVEIADPAEWQDVYARAIVLTGNPKQATDLTCERVKRLMLQRGEWRPVR